MTVQGAVEAIERVARRTDASVTTESLDGWTAMIVRESTTVPFWSGVPWTLVTVVASTPVSTASQMQGFADRVARFAAAPTGSDRRGVGTVAAAALMVSSRVDPDLGPSAVEPIQHDRVLVWPVAVDLERAVVLRAPRRLRGGAGGVWVSRRIDAMAGTAIRAGSAA